MENPRHNVRGSHEQQQRRPLQSSAATPRSVPAALTAVVELVALEDGDEDPDTDDELVGVADTLGVPLLVAVVLPVELLLAVMDDDADEELLVDAVADVVCTDSASGKKTRRSAHRESRNTLITTQ